jgi:hypothetical protein
MIKRLEIGRKFLITLSAAQTGVPGKRGEPEWIRTLTLGAMGEEWALVKVAMSNGCEAPNSSNHSRTVFRRGFMETTETKFVSGALPSNAGGL